MRRLWPIVFLFLAVIPVDRMAPAATYRWQCHGPYLGSSVRLANIQDLNNLVAVQDGGGCFFGLREEDGGTRWVALNIDLPDLRGRSVIVSRGGGEDVLWVGTSGGLYRTSNWGENWDFMPPLGLKTVRCLAAHPQPLGSDWIVFAGSEDGTVLASIDVGVTWVDRTGTLPGSAVLCLAVQPGDGTIVFAGLENGAIYKSVDAGATWVNVYSGDGSGRVTSIAVQPVGTSNKVFAGFHAKSGGGQQGVYRSTNGGSAWAKTSLDRPVNCLVLDPANPEHVYAGSDGSPDRAAVYRSTNGGGTWSGRDAGILETGAEVAVEALMFKPGFGAGSIFAGTADGGICYSEDAGGNWRWQYRGLTANAVEVATAVQSPFPKYAGTYDGDVFRSDSAGWVWERRTTGMQADAPAGYIAALAVDSQAADPDTLHAAEWNRSIYKSVDGGIYWERVFESTGYFHDLAVDPNAPGTILAASFYIIPAAQLGEVFRSTDAGENWEKVFDDVSQFTCLAFNPSTPGTVYLGAEGAPFNALFRSVNAGDSWGVRDTGIQDRRVLCVAVDPAQPNFLYAGTEEHGLFRSVNGGLSWTPAGTALASKSVSALAVDPFWPDTIYAGTLFDGVFLSKNGGSDWTDVSDGFDGGAVNRLVVDPADPSRVLAATGNSGVYFRHFIADLNMDEVFDFLDLVEYKYFLVEEIRDFRASRSAADLNRDRRLNVVDLVRMKLALWE